MEGGVKPDFVRNSSEFRCADHTSSGARGTSSWAETKLGAAMAWPRHCHGTSAPEGSASVAASNLSATTTRAAIGGQASGHGRSRSGLATEIAEHLVVCHAITRGVARIPRLEVVGAIEVEQLRPVGFPFDQDRFSTDEGLGGDFRPEGEDAGDKGRDPFSSGIGRMEKCISISESESMTWEPIPKTGSTYGFSSNAERVLMDSFFVKLFNSIVKDSLSSSSAENSIESF